MKILLKRNLFALLFFIVTFGLYVMTLPHTVQSGDTGELVTNAYHLRVSHPPGYPLWTIFYHLPVRYLKFESPFYIASLLTALVSAFSFLILGGSFKRNLVWPLLGVLATSTVIWKYAVLPDVFALHLLFLSLVYIVFLTPNLLNRWWMLLLVSLSMAHHHTIVFAFPIFLYAFWESQITKRKVLLSFLFALCSLSLYLLLFSSIHRNMDLGEISLQ